MYLQSCLCLGSVQGPQTDTVKTLSPPTSPNAPCVFPTSQVTRELPASAGCAGFCEAKTPSVLKRLTPPAGLTRAPSITPGLITEHSFLFTQLCQIFHRSPSLLRRCRRRRPLCQGCRVSILVSQARQSTSALLFLSAINS